MRRLELIASGVARLSAVLQQRTETQRPVSGVLLRRFARADADGTGQYYETIDLVDAMHPQTILAYDMNDRPLAFATARRSIGVGASVGLQMAKYVMRIEAIDSFPGIARARAAIGKIAATSVRGI